MIRCFRSGVEPPFWGGLPSEDRLEPDIARSPGVSHARCRTVGQGVGIGCGGGGGGGGGVMLWMRMIWRQSLGMCKLDWFSFLSMLETWNGGF